MAPTLPCTSNNSPSGAYRMPKRTPNARPATATQAAEPVKPKPIIYNKDGSIRYDPNKPRSHNPRFHGKKGRSGAPFNNTNATATHYLRAGKLPKRLAYIENRINKFRRHLEDMIVLTRGEVNICDAAQINSATKWERHGLLAQHWLRHEEENLSAHDRLKFSEAIAKASDNRDKCLRLLKLDLKPEPLTLDSYVTDSRAIVDKANGNTKSK